MEEIVYSRSVTKQATSGRVVDKRQIDRHYKMEELTNLYKYNPPDYSKRQQPIPPDDDILKQLIMFYPQHIIYKYHVHDSLLEDKPEQGLSEQEIDEAWEQYQNEIHRKSIVPNPAASILPNMPGPSSLSTHNIDYSDYSALASIFNPLLSPFAALNYPSLGFPLFNPMAIPSTSGGGFHGDDNPFQMTPSHVFSRNKQKQLLSQSSQSMRSPEKIDSRKRTSTESRPSSKSSSEAPLITPKSSSQNLNILPDEESPPKSNGASSSTHQKNSIISKAPTTSDLIVSRMLTKSPVIQNQNLNIQQQAGRKFATKSPLENRTRYPNANLQLNNQNRPSISPVSSSARTEIVPSKRVHNQVARLSGPSPNSVTSTSTSVIQNRSVASPSTSTSQQQSIRVEKSKNQSNDPKQNHLSSLAASIAQKVEQAKKQLNKSTPSVSISPIIPQNGKKPIPTVPTVSKPSSSNSLINNRQSLPNILRKNPTANLRTSNVESCQRTQNPQPNNVQAAQMKRPLNVNLPASTSSHANAIPRIIHAGIGKPVRPFIDKSKFQFKPIIKAAPTVPVKTNIIKEFVPVISKEVMKMRQELAKNQKTSTSNLAAVASTSKRPSLSTLGGPPNKFMKVGQTSQPTQAPKNAQRLFTTSVVAAPKKIVAGKIDIRKNISQL